MPTLLSIQASPRRPSVSHTLSQQFIDQWRRHHPGGAVVTRELATSAPAFVGQDWIDGAFIPADQRSDAMRAALAQSDMLVAELRAADHVLIGTPMYNYGVPALLKAYIDQIVRMDETYTPQRQGLLHGKAATVILASGREYGPGAEEAAANDAAPYLRRILAYIGITDVDVVLAGGTTGIFRGHVSFDAHIARFAPAVRQAAR